MWTSASRAQISEHLISRVSKQIHLLARMAEQCLGQLPAFMSWCAVHAIELPADCSLLQGGASAPGPGAGEAVVATMREKYGCPENRASLGRAGWSMLHSMAATYPEKPTQTQQSEMHQFISVCPVSHHATPQPCVPRMPRNQPHRSISAHAYQHF